MPKTQKKNRHLSKRSRRNYQKRQRQRGGGNPDPNVIDDSDVVQKETAKLLGLCLPDALIPETICQR